METEQTVENIQDTSSTDTVTDNSNNENNLEKQIIKALDEPEIKQESEKNETTIETVKREEQKQDNIIKCPEKFKNKDGSINLENLLKSYTEVEPLVQEKAAWEKERAELLKAKEELDNINKLQTEQAKQAGFDSVSDMQELYSTALLEANEYAKYLSYTENPEEVRKLLINYANNPSSKLMEEIEIEFAPEINKRVAVLSDREKQKFQRERQKQTEIAKLSAIENVISQAVDTNKEIFDYEPFKQLFIKSLHKYGDNFTVEDAKTLINTVIEMKNLFRSEFEKQSEIKLQNDKTTDKLASINNTNSAPISSQDKDIDSMSEAELRNVISKFI
ncbi:MAG: hypothetical protein LUH11_02955 [Candidatus Gastranaerophilales bacterium]|nr:hypothetical protein [Candidatus Gastranaerophilales bacterium]